MSDRKTPEPANGRPTGLAPETHNAEQDQRDEQAQDIAVDAQKEENSEPGGTESRKAPSPGVDNVAGHETDLVDVMRRMEDSGKIDNSAFSGEPDHDDEPSRYLDSGKKGGKGDSDPNLLHETNRP